MTIREAFEKAGHPAPNSLILREKCPHDGSLWYSAEDPFMEWESVFSLTLGRWCLVEFSVALDWRRDYSDEPASAFVDALPEVVREQVKP